MLNSSWAIMPYWHLNSLELFFVVVAIVVRYYADANVSIIVVVIVLVLYCCIVYCRNQDLRLFVTSLIKQLIGDPVFSVN